MRHRVLVAYFADRRAAETACGWLLHDGVSHAEITHLDGFALRAVTKAPEGAVLGGVGGALVGAIAGAIAAGGVVVIPSLGAVLAGPGIAALAGAGAVGTLGMLAGALLGARAPEYEATSLETSDTASGALVAVRCLDETVSAVRQILAACGSRCIRHGPTR